MLGEYSTTIDIKIVFFRGGIFLANLRVSMETIEKCCLSSSPWLGWLAGCMPRCLPACSRSNPFIIKSLIYRHTIRSSTIDKFLLIHDQSIAAATHSKLIVFIIKNMILITHNVEPRVYRTLIKRFTRDFLVFT